LAVIEAFGFLSCHTASAVVAEPAGVADAEAAIAPAMATAGVWADLLGH
jgi:hypothetical protein